MSAIRENGATSGLGVLATFGYDDLGRRTSLSPGNGVTTSYADDAVSRLASLAHDLAGTTADLTLGFRYNPASQIVSNTRSNDLYSCSAYGNGTTSSCADGLNRLSAMDFLSFRVGGEATVTGNAEVVVNIGGLNCKKRR